jgi:hypothetical protein
MAERVALAESIDRFEPLQALTDILLTNSKVLDVLKLLIAHV